MAPQFKTITILAVVILRAATEPLPSAHIISSKSAGDRVLNASMAENHAFVSSEGFLALEAKVDIHALLELLQQIPNVREAVLRLAEEIKAMKGNNGLSEIEHELERIKTEVSRSVNLVGSNVAAVVEHNRQEELKSIAKLLQSMFDQRANAHSTCDQTAIKEASSHVSNAISSNNKILEKFVTKLIRTELSPVINIVENNTKLLAKIDEFAHGDNANAFSSGIRDNLAPMGEELKKEINDVKGFLDIIHNDVTLKVESVLKTERAFYVQRLDSLEALVGKVFREIAFLVNKTQEIAEQQEKYFTSAVEEQVQMVQVVKRTHNFVKTQVQSATEAAARVEKAAAKTLAAGRSLGCLPGKSRSRNTLDTDELI